MASDIHIMVKEIRALLEQKYGVRARTFEAQVRKARRYLPRALRRELIYFAQAQTLADNPKLQRMIDRPRLEAAHRKAASFLERVDSTQMRRSSAMSVVASIAFGLLVTAVVVLVIVVQRGLI